MADSWRAGIAAEDHRKLVTKGIFKISRNPAFLAFDLVYVGILLLFFNWLLMFCTVFAMLTLHLQITQEEIYLTSEFGEDYVDYKNSVCRYFGLRKGLFWIGLTMLAILGTVVWLTVAGNKAQDVPEMSFQECVNYVTKGNSDSVITVGILKDGQMSYKVYGKDGKELAAELHTYEIGSLTKTFTALMIQKAVHEGKMSLSDTIDKFLELPSGNAYPTIEAVLTHTAGYKEYYLNSNFVFNSLLDRNAFYGTDKVEILKEAGKLTHNSNYSWSYSNFGYAVLGLVVEAVYNMPYEQVFSSLVRELGLSNTTYLSNDGDLKNYWTWDEEDGYAPAGAARSNVIDLLRYAQLLMTAEDYVEVTRKLESIDINASVYDRFDININGIGMAWIMDDVNGFIWHNGGTDDYNCYLGMCPKTNTAVVILSNLPSDYRLPATVIGVKLLKELQ